MESLWKKVRFVPQRLIAHFVPQLYFLNTRPPNLNFQNRTGISNKEAKTIITVLK